MCNDLGNDSCTLVSGAAGNELECGNVQIALHVVLRDLGKKIEQRWHEMDIGKFDL